MSDQENFIARWSRRKRDAQESTEATPAPEKPAADASGAGAAASDSPPHETQASQAGRESAEPEFDLTSLPSIESISATSDIRAFLAPGVPPELTRAALRQAWVADPKIRNFVGLAENDWDFTNPDAMPGFGTLEMTEELRKFVAQIVTGARDALTEDRVGKDTAGAQTPPASGNNKTAQSHDEKMEKFGSGQEKPVINTRPSRNRDQLPQRGQDHIAPQQDSKIDKTSQIFTKRPHGRALPE